MSIVYKVTEGGTGITDITSFAWIVGNTSTQLKLSTNPIPSGGFPVGTTGPQNISNKTLNGTTNTLNTSSSYTGTSPWIWSIGNKTLKIANNGINTNSSTSNLISEVFVGSSQNGGMKLNPTVSPWTGYIASDFVSYDYDTINITGAFTITGTNVVFEESASYIYWTKLNRKITINCVFRIDTIGGIPNITSFTSTNLLQSRLLPRLANGTTASAMIEPSIFRDIGASPGVSTEVLVQITSSGSFDIRNSTFGTTISFANASTYIIFCSFSYVGSLS
jgi:hypothetical protein